MRTDAICAECEDGIGDTHEDGIGWLHWGCAATRRLSRIHELEKQLSPTPPTPKQRVALIWDGERQGWQVYPVEEKSFTFEDERWVNVVEALVVECEEPLIEPAPTRTAALAALRELEEGGG